MAKQFLPSKTYCSKVSLFCGMDILSISRSYKKACFQKQKDLQNSVVTDVFVYTWYKLKTATLKNIFQNNIQVYKLKI